MKLTYENCDKLHLTKYGYLRDKYHTYIYKDKCSRCGEAFLARNDGKASKRYCCPKCAPSGNCHYMFGKKASAETKQKMSASHKGKRIGKDNPMFNKKHSAESRQKMSRAHSGKNNASYKGDVVKLNIALYDTYGPQLAVFEKVRIHMLLINGVVYKSLQIPCHNSGCKKWFVPKQTNVINKLQAFNGTTLGEQNLYCSNKCKHTCSTYGQITYRKGENPNNKYACVSKPELKIWSKEVLKRANYKCEICGKKAKHSHHIEPKILYPEWALDPDNGIALCEECHAWLHTGDCSSYKLHERHQEKLLQESKRPVKERAPPS